MDSAWNCNDLIICPSSTAGGMRLPGGIDEEIEQKHYLTNAYVDRFGLKKIQFLNESDDEGYYYLYGTKYKIKCEIESIKCPELCRVFKTDYYF